MWHTSLNHWHILWLQYNIWIWISKMWYYQTDTNQGHFNCGQRLKKWQMESLWRFRAFGAVPRLLRRFERSQRTFGTCLAIFSISMHVRDMFSDFQRIGWDLFLFNRSTVQLIRLWRRNRSTDVFVTLRWRFLFFNCLLSSSTDNF